MGARTITPGGRFLSFVTLRKIGVGVGQAGIVLCLAFFVFQTTQSWCESATDNLDVRWILPTLAAVCTLLIAGGIFHVVGLRRYIEKKLSTHPITGPPEEELAASIVRYGTKLRSEGRNKALTTLRNNFSHTLHVLGFHDLRTELGALALESAAILDDPATRAEVLVDDLGWAHFLLGHNKIAEENIQRGITVAADARATTPHSHSLRLALCQAKGLRHLALINVNNRGQDLQDSFDTAINILKGLDHSNLEVKREIAQIRHARALAIATRLDIHKTGIVRAADTDGRRQVNDALSNVKSAATEFKAISDLERYAKALALEVRLLEAKQSLTEAKEVSAMRDRILAESEWVRAEGQETITGV